MMSTDKKNVRKNYKLFYPITTRWMDNDIYGHVNNVTYYSYFDTAANTFLIEECGLDIHHSDIIGFVVNSGCEYFSPIAFPDQITAGFRIDRIGNSSIQYGVGIFKENDNNASAAGHFVHVFVDRNTNKSIAIPDAMRAAMLNAVIK